MIVACNQIAMYVAKALSSFLILSLLEDKISKDLAASSIFIDDRLQDLFFDSGKLTVGPCDTI